MRCSLLGILLFLAVSTPGAPAVAAGPSFDCGHAAAPVERLICGSDKLAALDDQLAMAFRSKREGLDEAGRAAMLLDQRRWIQARLAACNIAVKGDPLPEAQRPAAETCLVAQYQDRLKALAAPAQVAAATAPAPAAPAAAPSAAPKPNAPAGPPPAAAPAGSLEHSIFPARGANETLLTVPTFGRYSIAAKSDQGTSLQLVDRMAGPGPVQGIAGAHDGRVDAFLDRGTYKLRLVSDLRGAGDAELSVRGSTELETQPVRLVEL